MSPSHRDDELISAVLDGEATPEEVSRVESDPELQQRLATMRAATEAVAQPVAPLDELSAARLRSAAVAEWPVQERKRWATPWLAVAAAVAVVVGIAGMLGGGLFEGNSGDQISLSRTGSAIDGGSRDEAVASAPEVADELAEPPTARPPDSAVATTSTSIPVSGEGATQTVAALEVPALADAEDFEEWAKSEAVTLQRAPSPEVAYGAVNERVPVSEITCPQLPGDLMATGTVTFAGAGAELSVWLDVGPEGAPVVRAQVRDLATCVQLALTELSGP